MTRTKNRGELAGRVAVLVGAGSGIGQALAVALAAQGMHLVLADANPDALAGAVDAAGAAGADVLAMVCDVRRRAHLEELADAAMIRFHGVHLLVNGAAADPEAVALATTDEPGSTWELDDAAWEEALGIGLQGTLHAVRVFTPLMLACAGRDPHYRGQIVNLVPAGRDGACVVRAQAVQALSETIGIDLASIGAPLAMSVVRRDAGMASDALVAQLLEQLVEHLVKQP